jgi:hypothetical protein
VDFHFAAHVSAAEIPRQDNPDRLVEWDACMPKRGNQHWTGKDHAQLSIPFIIRKLKERAQQLFYPLHTMRQSTSSSFPGNMYYDVRDSGCTHIQYGDGKAATTRSSSVLEARTHAARESPMVFQHMRPNKGESPPFG